MTFLMSLARAANRRVPIVSSTLKAAGLQHTIIMVLVLPWSESWGSKVTNCERSKVCMLSHEH